MIRNIPYNKNMRTPPYSQHEDIVIGLNAAIDHVNGEQRSVKEFGAVGDGVTDDTVAIQAAVDSFGAYTGASFAAGGVDLYFPPGNYLISSTIVIENSVRIVGAGSDNSTTISLADNSDCDMIQIGVRNSSEPVTVHLEGFRMYMDWENQASGYANIRTYNYIRHSHFNDLFLFGATSYNFIMTRDGTEQLPRNNYFYGCAFEDAVNGGADIDHDYNLNIHHCYFGFAANPALDYRGIRLSMSAQNFHFTNNWFLADCSQYNMFLDGTTTQFIITNNTFISDDIGTAGTCHLYISGNCNIGTIHGNTFVAASGNTYDYCIRLQDADNVTVSNNLYGGWDVSPIFSTDKSKQKFGDNFDMINNKVTRDESSATITNTNSTVTVTHDCITTPTSVTVACDKDEHVWVTAITSTQFTLNRAGVANDLKVYYTAKCES